MTEILEFLVRYCSFLWDKGRYRIVDSDIAESFGGDAYLIVSSRVLRMRFVRDRGQLFLDFQEAGASEGGEWYSVDLIYRLLEGSQKESAILSEDYAEFLRSSLTEIEAIFADASFSSATKKRLRELKRLRAKEMRG